MRQGALASSSHMFRSTVMSAHCSRQAVANAVNATLVWVLPRGFDVVDPGLLLDWAEGGSIVVDARSRPSFDNVA